MHGVRRDRSQQTAELKAQRKEREAKKLQVYLDVELRFFAVRDADSASSEALDATTELLSINPELYSAWNFRRRILERLFVAPPEDALQADTKDIFASLRIDATTPDAPKRASEQTSDDAMQRAHKIELLQGDLELTSQALRMHPKVYWIWNHRKWCLLQLPSAEDDIDGLAKWKFEIGLVNKMLERDPRNFHGWDYRRYIQSELATPSTLGPWSGATFPRSLSDATLPDALREHQLRLAHDELAYTFAKIEANFSNFSAWHQRSLLLPAIWKAERLSAAEERKRRDDEFELLRQAMFVDPDDQSVWTYHEWLVSLDPSKDVLEREIASIRELLELEPDSRWCMQTLAHYITLDAEQDPGSEAEANKLLERLAVVDPDRRQRYTDTIGAPQS